jgi:general secretion pathway protein D
VAATGGGPPRPANPAATSGEDTVGLVELHDESLDQVLALMEHWTGRSILRPQALPTVTFNLTMPKTMTRDVAVRALETLLALNGIAVAPFDQKFLKVTPMAQARAEAPEMIEGSTLKLAPSGRIGTKLFQLRFLRANEFLPQVQSLLNPAGGGSVVAFDKANVLLVTETITNLRRIEILIDKLDQPTLDGLETKFYALKFAKAGDVVAKMRTILASVQAQLGSGVTYNADERANQIVLMADPRQRPFFDQLIDKLDVSVEPNTQNEVIHLRHASATEVAQLLSQLVAGQTTAQRTAGQNVRSPAAVQPGPGAGPSQSLVPGVSQNEFSGMVTILPEERGNALLVSGTSTDIRLIRELVDKIDIILAQVRIEVVIAEVTLGNNSSTGIEALGLKIDGDRLVGFEGSTPGLGVSNGVVTRPGVVGSGNLDLAAILNLTTTPRLSNATILSVPNIVTTHNKEARIFVGESRPIISSYLNDSTTGGTAGVGTGYRSTVTSKDIGIELTVKPLIGNDGTVQLEIKQKVEDVLGDVVIDGNPQPRIGRRETSSFVVVKSGDIAVLGGLQRNTDNKSTSRLGPVPLIGDLLGKRVREKSRTDLVFFLRPMVLGNSPADNAEAMQHVDQGPQREAVRQALGIGPAGKTSAR